MPELPETETIARDLDGAVTGAIIVRTTVVRADVLRDTTAASVVRRTAGARVARVWRRAKSVILDLAGGLRIVVTPRFTGALLIERRAQAGPRAVGGSAGNAVRPAAPRSTSTDEDYTCLAFDLADGRRLRYRDVRRLGTVALMTPTRFAAWDAALGPEPLDPAFTAERFSGIVRASSRAVKTILMEQRRLAGIGNIYANEALWRAGMRPTRRGRAVTRAECARLFDALRAVLTESIALRGTSFRDYRDAFGVAGGFVARLAVYGRAGEPCLRCGATLHGHHALDGRATVYCAACQR